MPMLTFDRCVESSSKQEESIFGSSDTPDLIEIGENNDVWFKVRRSTKTLVLISKQTGAVVVRCEVSDTESLRLCGLTPQQYGAMFAAFTLGPKI